MQPSERIGLRIKLHDLRVLIVVVRAGSMGKAARQLNTTQPAISRSIAELEKTTGVRLLERTARGVAPTPQGAALLEGGLAAFDDLRRAARNIEHLSDPAAGIVEIGCTPILAAGFVATVVAGLARRHPRMVFTIVTEYLEPLRRRLRDRTLDLLVVRRFVPAANEPFAFEVLSQDRYVVAVGRHNALARRRVLSLGDLAAEPWTLPPADSVIGQLAADAFGQSGLQPPVPRVISTSPETRLSLLAAGHFVTIFPESILSSSAARSAVKVLPIALPAGQADNTIVTLEGRAVSKAAELFAAAARDEALRAGAAYSPDGSKGV